MAEHVSFEMTRPFTCVVAMIAAKRYLPSVFRHVCLQTMILRGFLVAVGANERPLSRVLQHVPFQNMFIDGGVIEVITFI